MTPKLDEEAIFNVARQIAAPEARRVYLQQSWGDDAALQARVEALLRVHDEQESFLKSPAEALRATVDAPICGAPGMAIGPYKLLQQIGEGGMGTVFMAEQTRPVRRKVALKVVKSGMDSRQVLARFEAERQALALMDHPNIAKVLGAGTTECGRPYFAMELVKGVPITRYCDEHHLTCRERLELFVPVCQAVQHAHQKGIIHRDLKPSNVMVCLYDDRPVPKIIDFGVAKAAGPRLTERTLFTEFGSVVGTLEYMSPEQAGLNNLDIDTRSDIYSLGVLLYELLTGTTPLERKRFQAAAVLEVLRLIREEESPRPSTRLSTAERLPAIAANRGLEPKKLSGLVRGELDWIVMKALDKDRGRRYQTANGLAMDVQRYLADETVVACPPSTGYRLRKLARRHKAALATALGIALALLFAVVGLALSNLRVREEQWRTAEALGQTRREERAKAEQLWQALVAQARANRLSRRAGQRVETLDILQRATQLARTLDLPADKFHDLRNAVIATLALPDLSLAGPWNTYPADTFSLAFDEAHAVYARTDRQGTCSIRRVADDAEIHHLAGLGAPAAPHLSRDGKFVAVHHFNRDVKAIVAVHVWHLGGLTPRRLLCEAQGYVVDFHPNAQQVAVAYNGGAIVLFELPSGRQLHRLEPDTLTREIGIALHPTEAVVAVCSYFGSVVQLRDLRTGEVIASLPQPTRAISIAWSPDGRTLAVGGDSPLIRLYDRTTLQPYRTLETSGSCSLVFNHAGDRLVSGGWGSFIELFDVGTGRKLFATTPVRGTCRFSRDDRRLAGGAQDGKLGIWQVGDSREYRTLVRKALPEKSKYTIGAVNADGRLLAAAMTDGFELWDLATGSELAFVPMNVGVDGVTDLRFEPSGALLTTGVSGLFRWPIRANPNAPDRLVVGPPERLPLRTHSIGQSRDGRVIVGCDRAVGLWQADAGGWILHSDRPNLPIRFDAGADIGWIAVSPDGRWVVTVNHTSRLVKVWDARDGRLVEQLAEWGYGSPRFSPDGRWLSINGDSRLIAVGTWGPGPPVGGYGVFSPASKLMALETTNEVIRLVDAATGREIARLADPHRNGACSWMGFTPDGTQLVTVDQSVRAIHVWDLRAIRRQLKGMDLDWDWPEFAPADLGSKVAEPRKVEVLLGDKALLTRARAESARQAIESYRRRLEASPNSADACNNLAWAYLTAPEALRDVKAALPLAEKAVRLKSGDADYRNTLGAAYYRDGQYRQAVETLRPNLASQKDSGLALDLYFLAMSQHRLGETARARDCYALAVRWTRAERVPSAAPLDELGVVQAEAAELLGIGKKKD